MTGKQFELIRREMELTQVQLAELMELGETTVVRIESKKKVKKIYALAIKQLQGDKNAKNQID